MSLFNNHGVCLMNTGHKIGSDGVVMTGTIYDHNCQTQLLVVTQGLYYLKYMAKVFTNFAAIEENFPCEFLHQETLKHHCGLLVRPVAILATMDSKYYVSQKQNKTPA